MTYQEQIKSPQWQKKRLEILERDAFVCRDCRSSKKQLHVHHIFYLSNKKPWEYPNEFYVTLCEDCHKKIHSLTENLFISIVDHCENSLGSDCIVDYIMALSLAVRLDYSQMKAYSNYFDKSKEDE